MRGLREEGFGSYWKVAKGCVRVLSSCGCGERGRIDEETQAERRGIGGEDVTQTVCKADGCRRPQHSRGWCGSHYYRAWQKGDFKLPEGSVQMTLRRTGATHRQVNYWVEQGYISGDSSGGSYGSGRPRSFTPEEEARIVLLVRASRLSLTEVADLLWKLERRGVA